MCCEISSENPGFCNHCHRCWRNSLAGIFYPDTSLAGITLTFLNWALILTAVVLLVGILNLLFVHLKKIRTDEKNAFYSLFLVIALSVTFSYRVGLWYRFEVVCLYL